MKFLTPLDNDDIMSVIDVLSMSLLFYNEIKHEHIESAPAIIDNLAHSLINVARHNAGVKERKDLAVMAIDPADLVKKVERNGRVFGVISGGRAK